MTATLATPASNAIVNPADERPLSPWWLRAIGIVMVIGFTVLIAITALAYRNAPPIPHLVADPQGKSLFTDADIGDGQAVFLKYGLMDKKFQHRLATSGFPSRPRLRSPDTKH